RGRRRSYGNRLRILVVACMQSARRLDPRLRAEIQRVAEQLVPPSTNDAAEALAGVGEILIDLMRAKPPRNATEAATSIRALSRVGSRGAMQLISDILARHKDQGSSQVQAEAINAWRFFKPEDYAREVLAQSWPPERELPIPDLTFMTMLHL